jgi:hypothetical protein
MKTLLLFLLTTICFASYTQQWQGTNPIYLNAGKVGIGTNNPLYQLQVNSATTNAR